MSALGDAGVMARSHPVKALERASKPRAALLAALKRWDGLERSCKPWNVLQRDPELWVSDGNCFVHLHSNDRLREAPSFKLPFSALMAANCLPFVQRFLVTEGYRPQTTGDIERWYRVNPGRTIELHIPLSSSGDEMEALHRLLAIRNFVAWVVRRPLVGEHLGSALVALSRSMHEFRSGVEDHARDLLDYVDEEGYSHLTDQPDHAMALLCLAESLQLRALYIRAFAHCVGMSERLWFSTEYRNVSFTSRELIIQARADVDARLEKTSAMLKDFLDEELSEAHVGIPLGIRAHLERFRSFLLSFYSVKLGYYPPRSFSADIYRTMRDDFAALYKLLKDDGYTSFEVMPSAAVGGMCTLQLVQSLDARNRFEPLQHPLPRLPQLDQATATKRIWLPWGGKSKADRRHLEHAALVEASNWRQSVFQNDLVRAYRRFEEDAVASWGRTDRHEKVSPVDARKIRWLLIYAVHQTLRHATQRPAEVADDGEGPYLLAMPPMDNLPPWEETSEVERQVSGSADMDVFWGDASLANPSGRIEIKPDIDYFALTHQAAPCVERRQTAPVGSRTLVSETLPSSPVRRVLRRSLTFRRSVRWFTQAATAPTTPVPARPLYQDIVVHEYGNGANQVGFDAVDEVTTPSLDASANWASRSSSTASQSNSSACSRRAGIASPAETLDSYMTAPSPTSTLPDDYLYTTAMGQRYWSPQDVSPSKTGDWKRPEPTTRRPASAAAESHGYARSMARYVEKQFEVGGVTRRHSTIVPDLKRKGSMPAGLFRGAIDEEHYDMAQDSYEWTTMQAFLDHRAADGDADGVVLAAWEQYAELGGLTELR